MDREIIESLERLGLTKTEAEIYLALLSAGASTGAQLIEITGVHQPQFYNIMTSLHHKGFVEISETRPKHYKAIEPEIALEKLASEMIRIKKDMVKKLSKISQKILPTAPTVWITKGYYNIIKNAIKTINSSDVDIFLSGNFRMQKSLIKSLDEARKRGCSIFTIVHPHDVPQKIVDALKKIGEVRVVPAGDFAVISDSKKCIFAQRTILSADVENHYGFVISDPTLTDLVMHDLTLRWIRGQIVPSKAPQFPRRFTLFRLASLKMKNLMEKGSKVEVAISGKYIKTGEVFKGRGIIENVRFDLKNLIFNFTVRLQTGATLVVGGADAALEDVAADLIEINPLDG